MKEKNTTNKKPLNNLYNRITLGMKPKLIIIFMVVKIIPLLFLSFLAWRQILILGDELKDIAVNDSSTALNNSAVENIERMTMETASKVAEFLYGRDNDILYLSSIEPTEENYQTFADNKMRNVIKKGEWVLSEDGLSWVPVSTKMSVREGGEEKSTNGENNDMNGFHYREPDVFEYQNIPLYDEVTYIDLEGNELVKVVTDSTKVNYPMDKQRKNVSDKNNTYVKAENYFESLQKLKPGEIYVSDVIGAYVGSNYIGMYAPEVLKQASEELGYDILYDPYAQSYAGKENPNGQRFEGIVRFATPVQDEAGNVVGYVTIALNHDHIMEFVDHLTPNYERYTDLPSAYDGNYAFIWDYKCRNICHPRHNSIVGYDPETGDPQIPWLESSIYDEWQESGVKKWTDFVEDLPLFDNQSREKIPAPQLTRQGLVGLDGRYLNNAPQCTGWMDLTEDGGSGSFYILWSGLYKLTTAGAIPYYTGQYAPSEENNYSLRGFGIVTIGAGLEDFTGAARQTEENLGVAIANNLSETMVQLLVSTLIVITFIIIIAVWLASSLTGSITALIDGISRFRSGERQFRFHTNAIDEFGTLANSFDDMADSIVNSTINTICITDMNRKIIYMNEYGLELTHKTLESIVGTSYGESSIYSENTIYCPITALEESREAEILYIEEIERYVKGKANYFLSKDGEKIGYIIETADVTEMVNEQIKIEEQRSLLDSILSSSPDLIWCKDKTGRYLTVNPRFADVAGVSPIDFIGKMSDEVLPEYLAEILTENDDKALASSKPLYTEEKIPFADAHEEILDTVRTPIYDFNGKLIGILGFGRNVTVRVMIESELRNTQNELEQAVSDANKANQHKGDFLARMSHEIRTPMNAIIGITNIVIKKLEHIYGREKEVNDVIFHVHQIETSSQHLLGLLNDILDISKIEAGKIELVEETVNLTKLSNTVISMIKPRCEEKNISFITKLDTLENLSVISDSLRLRQVLINLLGNAVKFTPECGVIELRIEKKQSKDNKVFVEFAVKDNGIGISEESIAAIFKPFEQGGNNITRQYGGTGLGLSISRKIVQMFGGDIEINSIVGEGSTFGFAVWLEEAKTDAQYFVTEQDLTGKLTGKKLLLVDDVDINRMIVASMLENTGIEVDEADDGVMAVKKFEDSDVGEYDIILMDVQMPNMDGYEATEQIRKLNRQDALIVPIITLTANAFKEDIDRAIKHGMNAHISKPVESDKLMDILARFLIL